MELLVAQTASNINLKKVLEFKKTSLTQAIILLQSIVSKIMKTKSKKNKKSRMILIAFEN